MEFYCVKCRKKTDVSTFEKLKAKNGRNMLKGKCSVCGTTVCKFVKE